MATHRYPHVSLGILARRAEGKYDDEIYRWHDIQYMLDIIEEQKKEIDKLNAVLAVSYIQIKP